MRNIILAIVVLFSVNAFSAVSGEVKVKGIIEGFSDNDVILIQDGNKYIVSRSVIPKEIKIEPKKEIEFYVTLDLFEKAIVQN